MGYWASTRTASRSFASAERMYWAVSRSASRLTFNCVGWGQITLIESTIFGAVVAVLPVARIEHFLRTQTKKMRLSQYFSNLRCRFEVSLHQCLFDLVLQLVYLECLILSCDKHRHAVSCYSYDTSPYWKLGSQLQVGAARVCLSDGEDCLEMVQFDLVMRPFVILRAKIVKIIAKLRKLSLA